ncbi:MAG: anthranilate synthase component I family protein [Pseudomonadota bacterium]
MTQIRKWIGNDINICASALADHPHTVFFDSNRQSHPDSEYSLLCWQPTHIISIKDGVITIDGEPADNDDLFDILDIYLEQYSAPHNEESLPFIGGLVGYFSYDFGSKLQDIPLQDDDLDLPDALFGLYENVLMTHHQSQESWIIASQDAEDILNHALKNIQSTSHPSSPVTWSQSFPQDQYEALIDETREEIAKGEFYQVNMTYRLEAERPHDFSSYDHYQSLRETNSAPFSLYANYPEFQILSCSPEKFLSVHDNLVTTKPIKGTLPSSQDASQLQDNPKERAENIMIVDLLRNDISQSCAPHSVTVPKLCEIETFENIHHLVSTIEGELSNDHNIFDLLESALPGGSITGAPKIAAMTYIAKKEPVRRGLYCGSFGYIGFDHNAQFNILIRTLITTNNKLIINAGSGIVYDSVPQKEYQETQDKISKILESFNAEKMDDAA